MNLIEQLGGYEKAKLIVDKSPCKTYTYHNHPYQKGYIRCWGRDGKDYFLVSDIEKALLEYRRQHNIFEVGDKVVVKNDCLIDFADLILNMKVLTVLMMTDDGFIRSIEAAGLFKSSLVRHATDEEIEAGKRLEVK
ncbi:hypothetical protein [Acinetobacter towneri]|uniref:hypothetical protein n=1 Tax=Acinetobacter towneri TaxID=202956 RepID=UPI001F1AC897|nr:hypothetical protein [Acinetobacter towneri]UIP24552.1 hypothetical protein LZG54_10400 [Acinetobacter towneri]